MLIFKFIAFSKMLFSAVHCSPLEVNDPHVTARVEGSRLGHTAVFQCPTGFVLNGTSNLTCHATGKFNFISLSFLFFVSQPALGAASISCRIWLVISILPDQRQQKSKFNNHRVPSESEHYLQMCVREGIAAVGEKKC